MDHGLILMIFERLLRMSEFFTVKVYDSHFQIHMPDSTVSPASKYDREIRFLYGGKHYTAIVQRFREDKEAPWTYWAMITKEVDNFIIEGIAAKSEEDPA